MCIRDSCKPKQAAEALAELARRSDGKVPSHALKRPTTPEVKAAVSREVEDTAGTATDNNPFPSARSQLRNIMEQMTHRNAEVDSTMKTVTYRLFNMSGLNVHGSPEDMNVITDAHVHAIAGRPTDDLIEQPAGQTAVRILQSQMRSLASRIQRMNSGSAGPDETVDEIIEILINSPVTSEQTRLALREEPNVRDIVLGRADAPGSVIEMTDRLKEQVAYTLNGLITHPQARKDLSAFTHYGDLFIDNMNDGMSAHDFFYHSRTAPSHMAADYFQHAIKKMSIGRRAAMQRFARGHGVNSDGSARAFFHATPNGIALDQNRNPILEPSKTGQQGDGIYTVSYTHLTLPTKA